MFKKKPKNNCTITFDDNDIQSDKAYQAPPIIRVQYDDAEIFPVRKYVKIDPVIQSTQNTPQYSQDYLQQLFEENKQQNQFARQYQDEEEQNYIQVEADEEIQEIKVINIEESDNEEEKQYVRDAKEKRNNLRKKNEFISYQPNQMIDVDQRMPMMGEYKPYRQINVDNSDDDDFNRLENDIIRANKYKIKKDNLHYNDTSYQIQSKDNRFLQNISSVTIQSITYDVNEQIQQDEQRLKSLNDELIKTQGALKSSEHFSQVWGQKLYEQSDFLTKVEGICEYISNFHDMMKDKSNTLLYLIDQFEDNIEAYIEQSDNENSINILVEYSQDLYEILNDVDSEYLDITKLFSELKFVIGDNQQMEQSVVKMIAPLFQQQIILNFINQFYQDKQNTDYEIFTGTINNNLNYYKLLNKLILESVSKVFAPLSKISPQNSKFANFVLQTAKQITDIHRNEELQNYKQQYREMEQIFSNSSKY
ncbi:hypothetical protein pb186bvf_003673 [Paramecium bursaria]